MKKLLTLFVVCCALKTFAQPPIEVLCLVGSDPPPVEYVQPYIDLLSELGFNVTVEVLSATASTSGYDVAVIGENIGSEDVNQKQYSTAPIPLLLWKPHNVKPGGLNWAPDRGDNTPDMTILVESDHEVLTGLPDDEIVYCEDLPTGTDACGWVYIPPVSGYTVVGENADADADHQALAAIDKGTDLQGNVLENRAFIFVTSGESFSHFTDEGKLLLSNIINWLAGRTLVDGIKSQSSSGQVVVYPNPASGIINVKLDEKVSNLEIRISSIVGRLLYSKQFSNTSFEQLDLSELNSGTYFIQLKGSDVSYIQKVFINN
jgi:hypothetical protein